MHLRQALATPGGLVLTRQDGEQMRDGSGRDAPWDHGSDWFENDTREPGSRRERSAVRGPSARPSGPAGRRAPNGRGGRPGYGGGPGRRSPWRRFRNRSLLHQLGFLIATLGAVVVVVVGVGAFTIYQRLVHNIKVVQVAGLTHRSVYGAQNFLILGSQTRQGQDGFKASYDPTKWVANSDNLLIVHLDPTHTHATVLSIPRDTMVYEPACKDRNHFIGIGTYPAMQSAIIDGALNIGGPSCAVATVKDLTGIKLDHFVEFDFNSFRTMVDALGGVEVCVPKGGYHDPASKVSLSPGLHLVTYNQALAYVRTRHILGGADAGGDLERIPLQQAFISSVIQKVNSTGLLTNSVSLFRVAETATKALTVDQGMSSLTDLLHLAKSMKALHSKNVSLITMPTVIDPTDSNRLLPLEPEDDVLFGMIVNGTNWHGHLPLTPPHEVQVKVLNATGIPHLASRTARALRALGFDVVGTGDATATSSTTITYSGVAQADDAYTLIDSLRGFRQNPSVQPVVQNLLAEPTPPLGTQGAITLILGADYANFTVNKPPTRHAGSQGNTGPAQTAANQSSSTGAGAVQARNAGSSICSGLPLGNN